MRKRLLIFVLFLLLYIPFVDKYGFDLVEKRALDFPSYYGGVKIVFENRLLPYNRENWVEAQEFFPHYEAYAYLYPPPSLLFFTPLLPFEFETAKLTFLAFNHLLILAFTGFYLFRFLKLRITDLFAILILVYLLTFWPLKLTLDHGQINIVILFLICITWYLARNKSSPLLAALALSVATVIKLYPAFLIAYFLIKRQYRLVLWTLLFILAFCIAATLILPAGIWLDWAQNILGNSYGSVVRGLDPSSLQNQSNNGFTSRLFLGRIEKFSALVPNPAAARIVPLILGGVIAVITLGLAYLNGRKEDSDKMIDFEMAANLIAMNLIAPISWDHHLVLLFPAAVLALNHQLTQERNYFWMLIILATTILIGYQYPFSSYRFREGIATLWISMKVYATLLLWLFFIVKMWGRWKGRYELKGIESTAENA